jgi:tetratricopeptide (TPR) repeat protein
MPKIYGIISIILLGVMFVLAKRKNYRMMIFGGVWFFLFFILTLIKPASTTPDFSENRIYLPMLGFIFIIIGLEPDQILNTFYQNKRKLIAYSSLTILFVIFSSITIYRNRYYINKMNFWQNAVVTSPSFAFNHNNLGAMYYLDNKFALAEEEFQQAITLNANEKLAHNNLGLIYMRNNQFLEAEVEFNKELHINPLYDNAYANLGILFFKMKKLDKGAENFEKVLKINPDRMDALQALAVYYNQKNDLVRATYYANEYNKRAAQLSP